jgi:hypothetical protein
MQPGFYGWDSEPKTAVEVMAEAVKRDVWGRLEEAMYEDDVVAEFLSTNPATVMVDVVVDRELGQGQTFETRPSGNAPFAAAIAQPVVMAMVRRFRERILEGAVSEHEPICFEVAFCPEDVRLSA